MKNLFLFVGLITLFTIGFASIGADVEDNEFAEFETEDAFQDVETPAVTQKPVVQEKVEQAKPDIAKNDDFDDDYGVADEEPEEAKEADDGTEQKAQPLKFADVPAHFRSNWASYQVEALILVIIALYLVNYVAGKSSNSSLAKDWVDNNTPLLEQQFALVGDDGVSENPTGGYLHRETDCSFSFWCSGRTGVSSLHIQIKTKKRQDLISRGMELFSPQQDRIIFKFELDAGEMDSIILAAGQRKSTTKRVKEMLDLSTFTTERKALSQYGIPESFVLFSEQQESAFLLFEPGIASIISKHYRAFEFIHVSDQFSGPKPPEGETYTKMPDVSRLCMISVNISECYSKEDQAELMRLIFYIVDKIRKARLSREAKVKADKKRKEVEEAFLKTTHQLRQEAAQARREEKTRERKQRLLDEEDPEKQRRLEKLEQKREAKAKQPKMKQLRVKM